MAEGNKVIVTDDVHEVLLSGLREAGFLVDYRPDISNEELREVLPEYSGLIINSKIYVDEKLLERADRLTFIGRIGSGMDRVDLDLCHARGIACYRSPEGNAHAVAEHALGMLLSLMNHLHRTTDELRKGEWVREGNRGKELRGRVVGIIGYGHCGPALAGKLKGFGTEILVYDKYRMDIAEEQVKSVSLEEICERSDIISFHVPLTRETDGMLDANFIEKCHCKPILINTSRGRIARTRDLIAALKEGRISGLCIDVFEDEPLDRGRYNPPELYQELLGFPNVIASPHIAGWTDKSRELLSRILLEKILGKYGSL